VFVHLRSCRCSAVDPGCSWPTVSPGGAIDEAARHEPVTPRLTRRRRFRRGGRK
jgi:hypothetical protein